MSEDLERQLGELGPECRATVARLRAARTVTPSGRVRAEPPRAGRALGWLAAAALAAAVALAALVLSDGRPDASCPPAPRAYTLAFAADEEAVREMVRAQRPDGSWENDYLTRQNAAALRDVAAARTAYKRAVRYLRSRGLEPLSAEELKCRSGSAAKGALG